MKQIFLLFGLTAITLPTRAQMQGETTHIADKFGISVFANSHLAPSARKADPAMANKLKTAFPKWYVSMDAQSGGFKDLNGSPIAVPGTSLEEKARNLMSNQLSAAGINPAEWVVIGTQTTLKGLSYVYFSQVVAGKPVVFSKMNFRFTADGKIARINMKGYGKADLSLVPSIPASTALETALSDMGSAVVTGSDLSAADWEWFPVPSANGYDLRPAYKVTATGRIDAQSSVPLNLYAYVDAVSGALLYRDNETKDAADLHVIGKVYADGFLNPQRIVGLPYVKGSAGSVTLEANDTGFMSSSSLSLPADIVVSLEGKWSSVKSVPDGSAVPRFMTTVTAAGKADSFGNPSTIYSSSRHVNAYYHVNTVHDFMKSQYGSSFTGMDYPLVTNVDVTGSCNAFYTAAGGGSINFFPANASCPSYAEVRDVVYHEYGHAIVSKMYPGGMRNGGLNEGQADIWAMGITKDSVMGRGTFWSPSSSIRRYDISPKVFPEDLTGEVHANGEIIAGAWWDYGKNVGSVEMMSQLFADVLLNDKPDGPNGTEGEVYHEVLMSALVNDDDDANLSNGTPHFKEIVSAFARHGIYLLYDIDVEHSELPHQPAGKPIPVTAKIPSASPNPIFFKSMSLVYKTSRAPGTPWDTLAMTDIGSLTFTATIPAQAEATIVDYFFFLTDIADEAGVYAPRNYFPPSVLVATKVTLNYQFAVGIAPRQVVNFEAEVPADWQVGVTSDNATAGKWVWATPIGSTNSGAESQTGKDHTTGSGKCLVTGNVLSSDAYTQSVKNGITTVVTPLYVLTGYKDPIVEYYRWYGNFRGRNPKSNLWRVQMGTTAGTPFLKDVENTNQGEYAWRRKLFKPSEIWTGAKAMQLRFIAAESPVDGRNGLVEAALDDFVIYDAEGALDIPETSATLANIYPNPASDVINVILPFGATENVSIGFYDLTGKQVSSVPVTKGATHYRIPVNGMIPGQYLVVVQMNKTIQTSKVTVKGF